MKGCQSVLIFVALILVRGETKRLSSSPPIVKTDKQAEITNLPDPSELVRTIAPLTADVSMFLQAWESLYYTTPQSSPANEKFTVLIPKDAIFRSEFPPDTPNPLIFDDTFQKLILYSHIVHGKIVLPDVVNTARIVLTQAQTLDGRMVEFDTQIGHGFGAVNGVPIVNRPLETSNFLVYIIDDLLFVSTDDIIAAIERAAHFEPQGPPIPPVTFQVPMPPSAGGPKPPSIPLFLKAPAPPIDGPQPPAIPDPDVLALYGLLDDLSTEEPPKARQAKVHRGNVRYGATQNVNDYDKNPKVKPTLNLPNPPEILEDNTIEGVPNLKSTKYNHNDIRKKTAKNHTESVLSSLGIYQFLTAAVVTKVDLRGANLTLMAPSDEALRLRNISLPELLLRNPVHASRFIRNHILNGTHSATELIQKGKIVSQAGEILNFDAQNGLLSVNGIPVSKTNIPASNGMFHVLNGILELPPTIKSGNSEISSKVPPEPEFLPEGNTSRSVPTKIVQDDPLSDIHKFAEVYHLTEQSTEDNIAKVLQNNGASTLLSLLERANMITQLTTGGPYTILAPNDKAFADIPANRLQELTSQPHLLKKLLSYHIISQSQQDSSEVSNDSVFRTVEGSPVRFNIYDINMVLVGGAQVTVPDQDFSQGVVHVIDSVLTIPTGDLTSTMIQKQGLQRFVTAFAVNKTDMLASGGPWTVIVPYDTAFDALPLPWMSLILHHKIGVIESLKAHVIPGTWYKKACDPARNLTSITGHVLTCSYQHETEVLSFNGVPVIESDISATNGVLHVVPQLVIPPVLQATATPPTEPEQALNTFKPEFSAQEIERMIQEVADLLLPLTDNNNTLTVAPPLPVFSVETSTAVSHDVTVPWNVTVLEATTESSSIWDIMQQRNLSIFSKMLSTAGFKDLLSQNGPWTVFAPNNAAFSELPPALLQQLTHDRNYLNRVLAYHIAKTNSTRPTFKNELTIPSLSSDLPIRINLYTDGQAHWYTASGNKIVNLDELATNGVVHIVEGILYPPHGDLLTTVRLSPILMTMNALIDRLRLEDELAQLAGPITAFFPNDEILMEIDFDSVLDLDRLTYWFRSHIVRGSYYREGLQDHEQLLTLTNRTLLIRNNDEIHMNGADLVAPDITLTNGVLHIINVPLFDP